MYVKSVSALITLKISVSLMFSTVVAVPINYNKYFTHYINYFKICFTI
jgi:hypothetical protein